MAVTDDVTRDMNNPNNFPQKKNSNNMSAMASLFGAGLGVVGTAVTNANNRQLNADNNNLQLQLAREADDRNLRLWNATNQYNSPAAQRQRLIEAGLNPGLMYGGIDNTAGVPADSNVPQTSASQDQFNENAVSSAFNNAANIMDSNNALNTRIKEAQAESLEIDNQNKKDRQPLEIQNLKLAGEDLRQRIDENKKEAERNAERFTEEMAQSRERTKQEIIKSDMDKATYEEYLKMQPVRERRQQLENELLSVRIEGQKQQNRITKAQADRAAGEIAVIEALDEEMAQAQWLMDVYYPLYLRGQTNNSFRGNSYKSEGTMSAQEWLQSLPPNLRAAMLRYPCESRFFKFFPQDALAIYVRSYPETREGVQNADYKIDRWTKPKYKNIYYKQCNKSKLSPITNGYFNPSTDDSGSIGGSAFGFGLNVN